MTKKKIQKHASEFLKEAADQLGIKAQLRDQPQGERSMAATVAAFNALTGKNISESDGWKFMVLLKMVRGQQGKFNADDYIDGAAYFGLLGECESTYMEELTENPSELSLVPMEHKLGTKDDRNK